MTDETEALTALARDVFRHLTSDAPTRAQMASRTWPVLAQTGFAGLSVPEEHGGSGGTLAQLVAVLQIAGATALDAPLAETAMLAGWTLSASGRACEGGPYAATLSSELTIEPRGDRWLLTGAIPKVPWAHEAAHLVVVAPHDGSTLVTWLRRDQYNTARHVNLAGEPRDDVILAGQPAAGRLHHGMGLHDAFRRRGALARAALMAGAARQALDASVSYATQRVQFGRPIASFQIVESYLAEMAAEVTVLDRALAAATENMQAGRESALISLAAAKVQAGLTAACVARLAHQVHGAIGLTREHSLHAWTVRLWAWRDEYGDEPYWSAILAEKLLASSRTEAELWRQLSNVQPGTAGTLFIPSRRTPRTGLPPPRGTWSGSRRHARNAACRS